MRICFLVLLLASSCESLPEPTVTLTSPNGGELAPSDVITWQLENGDPELWRVSIALLAAEANGGTSIVKMAGEGLASGADGDGSLIWSADADVLDSQGAPIQYKFRVSASDGNTTIEDESDERFTLRDDTPTPPTWATIKPIFVTYCIECHGQPAFGSRIESFRFDKFDVDDTEPPENGDVGVTEKLSKIEDRLLMQGNMPPFGFDVPSDEEKEFIRLWIEGGGVFE